MPRNIQPDPILDNFSHDVYLYGNPDSILRAWQQQGYTHVLLNRRAVGFVLEKPEEQAIFETTISSLRAVSTSQDGTYELLEIPHE